jgi:hypothetical protein
MAAYFFFSMNFDQAPSFQLRQRTRFHDAHLIADIAFVLGVFGHELLRELNVLPVQRMLDASFNFDDDRFLHLVGDHDPSTRRFAQAARIVFDRRYPS